MAPPVPRSKLSRAIIQKAREWEAVIKELPMLEDFDNLEEAIKTSQARHNTLKSIEDDLNNRVKALTDTEFRLKRQVAELEKKSDEAKAAAAKAHTDAMADVMSQKDRILGAANEQSARIIKDSEQHGQTLRDAGKREADDYKVKLHKEVSELEERLAKLKKEEADMLAAHTAATSKLSALRQELSVGAN